MKDWIKLLIAVAIIVVAIVYVQSFSAQPGISILSNGSAISNSSNSKYPLAPELTGISGYINSNNITLASLKGKVVLVDFWTYSCINCIRTIPYLNSWYAKYKDQGLEII